MLKTLYSTPPSALSSRPFYALKDVFGSLFHLQSGVIFCFLFCYFFYQKLIGYSLFFHIFVIDLLYNEVYERFKRYNIFNIKSNYICHDKGNQIIFINIQ